MSIIVDRISYNEATDLSTVSLTHIVDAGADIIVVSIQSQAADLADRIISSVVLNPGASGESFTHYANCDKDDNTNNVDFRTEIWYLVSPTASGSQTITITASDTCIDIAAAAVSLFDVNTSSPIDSYAVGNGTSGDPTATVTTQEDGAFVLDSMADSDGEGFKISSNLTKIYKSDVGSNTFGVQYTIKETAGNQIMYWNDINGSNNWILSALAIEPAASVTPPFYPILYLKCNGVGGATSFPDDSDNDFTVTAESKAEVDDIIVRMGTGSCVLEGVSSYLTVPYYTGWNLGSTTNVTLEFFAKFTDHVGYEGLLGQMTDGDNWWGIYNIHGTGLRFILQASAATKTIMTGTEISDTFWHHIAVCIVGSVAGIYVGGTQIAYTATVDLDYDFTGVLEIGRMLESNSYAFDGNLDRIVISQQNNFSAAPNVGLTDTITVPNDEGPITEPATPRCWGNVLAYK